MIPIVAQIEHHSPPAQKDVLSEAALLGDQNCVGVRHVQGRDGVPLRDFGIEGVPGKEIPCKRLR